MKRMEMENRKGGKMLSLLERDDLLSEKFISRRPSVGFSSRIYYRGAEGVPFKWEMRPGKSACQQPQEEVIPPPSPSPAMQSLDLPMPSPRLLVEDNKRRKSNIRSKMDELLLSWKKMKKHRKEAKTMKNRGGNSNKKFEQASSIPCSCSDNNLHRFEFYSSTDEESNESSRKSTSSSSSSRFSSGEKGVVCTMSLRVPGPASYRNFLIPYLSCTPWNMSHQGGAFVRASRRV